ncbi:DUF1697 domain-containing protein [Streptococcus catagoni]|uniref:DUF1697 domain-containing protein n=1 Tax=Streptococcus catagoni TaxID=2654874 RepID=UPI00140CC1FE|nr:DUF1697 domain-containing protein [Streptococcus catagoni]
MKYLLLLRGINVGGHHKVLMAEFKAYLSELAYENINSYINSGNLYFESDKDLAQLYQEISEVIENHYTFAIPFLLIKQEDFLVEYDSLPRWWKGDFYRKNVLFLLPGCHSDQLISFQEIGDGEFLYIGDIALYWATRDEDNYQKSFYHKTFIKSPLYKCVSIRNERTAEFLARSFGQEKRI